MWLAQEHSLVPVEIKHKRVPDWESDAPITSPLHSPELILKVQLKTRSTQKSMLTRYHEFKHILLQDEILNRVVKWGIIFEHHHIHIFM